MISIKYRIIYADTDQMGVVYHSNYFKFFEMCRGEMMRKNNLSYKQVEDLGFMLPIIESHCEYKLPAKYDDIIEIFGKVSEVKGIRVKIEFNRHYTTPLYLYYNKSITQVKKKFNCFFF